MSLTLDPLPDFFRRRPQANNQGVAFQTCKTRFICRQTAAGCDDRFISPSQFLDDPEFPFAKSRLAMMLENFLNRRSRSRFDDIICIEKCVAQDVRHCPADRRFPRPHETNQGEVPNLAGTVHITELADFSSNGTRFLRVRPRENIRLLA